MSLKNQLQLIGHRYHELKSTLCLNAELLEIHEGELLKFVERELQKELSLRAFMDAKPRIPPINASTMVRVQSSSKPRKIRAGIVKITPPAIDSPAEPAVWTTLFSRIDAREPRALERARNTVIEMTAIGIEADTVRPMRRPR